MACGNRADAKATGLFVTTSAAPDSAGPVWRLAALIPDGVVRVNIDFADGTQQTVAVADNVIAADSSAAPVRARFADAAGNKRVQRLGDS